MPRTGCRTPPRPPSKRASTPPSPPSPLGATIGENSVILEGALVEAKATVLPGSVVPPGRRVPAQPRYLASIRAAARDILSARATFILGMGIANPLARNFAYLASMAVDTVSAIPQDGALPVDALARAKPQRRPTPRRRRSKQT